MKTIGSTLAANRGVGPGFDAMRVILAFGVIFWHCFPVTSGNTAAPATGPAWVAIYCIVPMFFALSGFLVAGSAMRLPLGGFVLSRALRIVPALFVDTAVSILLFGLAMTTLPPLAFLAAPQTLAYWLNTVGEIHYQLPGLFQDNPLTLVNASLWTIPGELCCYLAMSALIASRLVARWQAPLAGIVLLFAIDFCYHSLGAGFRFPMEKQVAGDTGKLVAIFLTGVIAYSQRDRIPLSPILALLAVAFIVLYGIFGSPALVADPVFIAGGCVALAYLVIWLGLQRLPLPWPLNTGDYSYGLYLYGFPIQQAVVHLTGARSPWVVLAFTVPTVLLLAAFSWHVVEKPTLRLRKRLSRSPS